MSYYDQLSEYLKEQNHYKWDYYKCHYEKNIKDCFNNPNGFINRTFVHAKKSGLIAAPDQATYQWEIPGISKQRAAHSISSFFLGFILAEGLIECNLNWFCNIKGYPFPFSYVWNLTSLYHDYGYQYENDPHLLQKTKKQVGEKAFTDLSYTTYDSITALRSELAIKHSIWRGKRARKRDLEVCAPNNQILDVYAYLYTKDLWCNNVLTNLPFRTLTDVDQYLFYRMSGYRGRECIDHGIAGGMIFFDLILKNYLKEYECVKKDNPNVDFRNFRADNAIGNNLRFGIDQTAVFLYIADSIINHNIWKASEENEDLYRTFGLNNLIGNKYHKISFHENPLLFVLCMSDTLEPYKNYFKDAHGCGIDECSYSSEDVIDLSKKYYINVSKNKIEICVPGEWYESCGRKLHGMEDWIDIRVESNTDGYTIIVK